jgi:hypothetical protein
VTDKVRSYGAGKSEIGLSARDEQACAKNNRAEELAPADTAARAQSAASQVARIGSAAFVHFRHFFNTFNLQRHLCGFLQDEALRTWQAATASWEAPPDANWGWCDNAPGVYQCRGPLTEMHWCGRRPRFCAAFSDASVLLRCNRSNLSSASSQLQRIPATYTRTLLRPGLGSVRSQTNLLASTGPAPPAFVQYVLAMDCKNTTASRTNPTTTSSHTGSRKR